MNKKFNKVIKGANLIRIEKVGRNLSKKRERQEIRKKIGTFESYIL